MLPEVISGVLDELDKGNEKSPRMRSVHYQPLKENSSDLLLNGFNIGLSKQRSRAQLK